MTSVFACVQSHISKQDGQIKGLQAERTSLSAQLDDVQANLHAASSLADQQVSINITALPICHMCIHSTVSRSCAYDEAR